LTIIGLVLFSSVTRSDEDDVKLNQILEGIDVLHIAGDYRGDISCLCYESKQCEPGSLFVAVPGLKYDGHAFISDAVTRGSRCIVHEKEIEPLPGITFVRVRDCRRALGQMGRNFYGDPSSEMTLIGVTGTNGKTTVTFLIESILTRAGCRVGVLGTINYRYAGKVFTAPHTTPESVVVQKILRDMADAGVTHVVMEVSSHAVDLRRIDDCTFTIGIFTNLSQDHLDYHETIDRYFEAKRRFFVDVMNKGEILINGDDPWGIRLLQEIPRREAVTYGIEHSSTITARRHTLRVDGISADVTAGGDSFHVRSPLMGRFNLYNILASVAAACSLGIPVPVICEGIEGLKRIPGRLEKVSGPGEPVVLVDYAHTEDALKKVLDSLLDIKEGRIITVFGCGGDRDRLKRPLMGSAAASRSDITVVTSDNPRSENPLKIIEEIERGIAALPVRKCTVDEISHLAPGERGYTVIPDRRASIDFAVALAEERDIVLIAGKGHEDYQILGDRKIFFDDRVYSKEALAQRSHRT
jgi:UDP-N-acetylmuramoyl-L-alanyl-D-glutamate--2,6-diaminopimelate ligase